MSDTNTTATPPSAVQSIIDDGKAKLQAIVDAGEAKSAALRAQRDALLPQQQALNAQVASLNQQIAAAEGADTQDARAALTQGAALRSGRPMPPGLMRRLQG